MHPFFGDRCTNMFPASNFRNLCRQFLADTGRFALAPQEKDRTSPQGRRTQAHRLLVAIAPALVSFDSGSDEGSQLALHVSLAVAVHHENFHVAVAGEVENLL
jgi:hypothetical protein